MKLVKRLKGISYEDRLRILWLSTLERRGLIGNVIALYNFLKRGSGEGGAVLFSLAANDRRENGIKLCQGRLDIREKFCIMRVVRHWNRLPREVVYALCLPVFKRCLDNDLKDILLLLASPEEVRQMD